MMVAGNIFTRLLTIPLFLLYVGVLGLGIYCMVLFIKVARRGITALDIYISKNRSNE